MRIKLQDSRLVASAMSILKKRDEEKHYRSEKQYCRTMISGL
jgi:hypothetical protein